MNKPVAPPLHVPDHLRERQVRASDPALSIWVSANAGSGKTHVLTQRVIRLLLAGTAPSRILCLTFTKAAAAQMATRVFRQLSDWTMMEDRDLRAAIALTGAPMPRPEDLVRARRLFTRTVETPGGLKIQTIHAFCERLLHLFPFEANVPARFAVADELRTGELMAAAKRDVIAEAQRSAGPLGAALALVADLAGAFGVDRPIAEAMALRDPAAGAASRDTLLERLGGGGYPDAEAVRRAMVHDGIGPSRWTALADLLAGGSKTDGDKAGCLRRAAEALTCGSGTAAVLELLAPIYFTAAGEERKTLVTAGRAKACPGLKEELAAEQARLVALRCELDIAETAERTLALLQLVDAVAARYEHAKAAGGLLDFDDLVDRTLQLLRRSDAGWVLHKLDSGIEHVLVDEAQDTSQAQWQILERLTADFAAGAGAGRADRSFFVVGDDKQSIFSFQGAAPLMFERMRSTFETRFRAGGKPFERVRLQTSFRSTAGILAAVDGVFAAAPHQDGLVQSGDVWPGHESIKAGLPALVEVWPRIKAEPKAADSEWRIPVDALAEDDPASELADRVARKVAQLCAPLSPDRVHEGGSRRQRPVRPGDILILVRTRNAFFEAVIRALKKHRVAVAGADRLDVANHIAVMDLVAAGRAALLPDDDLGLACVLKSPLFGLDDDDLIALAPTRKGPLLAALGASPDRRHRAAHATLARWRARAAAATPFAFYVELLGRDGGRRLMESRLGPEAHDAIDEFLRLALVHEREGAPSLSTFLAQVEALESSIKRDMENAADAVRVMTVHAAKGLEAKIVFLPDTCSVPAPTLDPVVFDLAAEEDGAAPVLAWSPRKADDPPAVARAREGRRRATMREYRRLLYVAMTRAEERLYLCGFFRAKAPPEDCWDAMIRLAFEAGGPDGAHVEHVPAFWNGDEAIQRITTAGDSEPAPLPKPAMDQALFDLAPPWLATPARDETPPAPRLRPSRVGGGADGAQRRRGALYGTAVHELLQHLPGVPAAEREAAGRAFLAARALPEDMRAPALAEALGVLARPELAPLFAPGSRAEVAVSGRLARPHGGERVVDGKVDRLAVTVEAVVVADFKTGAAPTEVPDRYVEQLALYRRVLQPLWPDRQVRALLVWTAGARAVWLDPAALEAAADAALAASA